MYAQNEGSHWYVDNGCSRHMSWDKGKLLTWNPVEKGNVTFGNNTLGKIVGKWVVNLSNGRGKAKNMLDVDGKKHNLLSVS